MTNSPRLALDEAGGVSIGGEAIGKLEGFRFVPDPRARWAFTAAPCAPPRCKGLESEIAARSTALAARRRCRHHAQRAWQAVVGRRHCRQAGRRALRRCRPPCEMLADAHVKTDALQARLQAWMTARIAARLGPLLALRDAAEAKTGSARRAARRSARHRPSAGGEFRRAGPRHAQTRCRKNWDRRSARFAPSASGSAGARSICPSCCAPMRRRC